MQALIQYIRLFFGSSDQDWAPASHSLSLAGAGQLTLPSGYLFAAEDDGRTEEPTPRKREKEREKGRVPKSQEIPSALVAIGGITILFFFAGWLLTGLGNIMKKYLGDFNSLPTISQAEIIPLMVSLVKETGWLLTPLFLAAMLMAVVGNVLQVGFMFTLKPLAFDFSRIKLDPATIGRKILLSKQVLTNLVKTLFKVSFLALVAYFIIADDFVELMRINDMGVYESLTVIGYLAFKLSIIMALVLALMAIPDYIFQRYEFTESIKMTKEEVKQEFKETEGDPLVKQRQRQRALELLRRNMFAQVKEADVVITNPTHFAVALRYDTVQEEAPRVMAKGDDHLAFVIRNIAKRNEIPIVENKALAREVYYTVPEGEIVPGEFYRALVEIFMNLESMRARFRRTAS